MGTYKRLPSQKERPAATRFVTRLDRLYHWLEINWKGVLAGIAAIAIVVGAVLVVSYHLGAKDDAAKVMYYKATKAPPGSDEAIELFEDLIKKAPSSGSAQAARLKLADAYYSKGDLDKAAAVLEPLTRSNKTLFRALGLENLAAVRLAKGDKKGAADAYLRAYEDTKNPARGISYFNAGLVLKEAGENEEAKKIFDILSKEETDFSTPELRERSKEQLIWMATK